MTSNERFAEWCRTHGLPRHDEHVRERARRLEEDALEYAEMLCEGPEYDDDSSPTTTEEDE